MLIPWDERRNLCIPGTEKEAVAYAADHWIETAKTSIARSGRFAAALSGGSTPKAIFQNLAQRPNDLDWARVWLFWSDERSVPPNHPDSNYHMAMEAGLKKLPLKHEHIFRMRAEDHIEKHALEYERLIKEKLDSNFFDLVMLGLGEDGHTASLFPHTKALEEKERLIVANHVIQKNTWRMTFTFPCIHQSRQSIIYALGESKASIAQQVLKAKLPSPWPASQIGTQERKAIWILDKSSSKFLII